MSAGRNNSSFDVVDCLKLALLIPALYLWLGLARFFGRRWGGLIRELDLQLADKLTEGQLTVLVAGIVILAFGLSLFLTCLLYRVVVRMLDSWWLRYRTRSSLVSQRQEEEDHLEELERKLRIRELEKLIGDSDKDVDPPKSRERPPAP